MAQHRLAALAHDVAQLAARTAVGAVAVAVEGASSMMFISCSRAPTALASLIAS